MRSSKGDTQGVLRLAAGMWAAGERAGAVELLEDASLAVPEAVVYSAALGAAAEGVADYSAARRHYVRFLSTTQGSDLGDLVATRLHAIRNETSDSVVSDLRLRAAVAGRGTDPTFTVALLPLRPVDSAPELSSFAMAATEVLSTELRGRAPYTLLDWEMSEEARRLVGPRDAALVAQSVGDIVHAHVVVWGDISPAPGDSVEFALYALRQDGDRREFLLRGSLAAPRSTFVQERDPFESMVWQMILGLYDGTLGTAAPEASSPGPSATDAFLALGEGLIALNGGDRSAALEDLHRARDLWPGLPSVQARIEQIEDLEAVERSPTLPFADEIVEHARRGEAIARLLGSDGLGTLTGVAGRPGVEESLGLDEVGAQLYADILIEAGP